MLFELSEVQKQEALIDNLQQSRKNMQDRLIRSYSKSDKSKYSLQEKFDSILKQSALLIHIFRQIEQGVQYKKLLPIILNQKDINKLLYSSISLPDWFDHVFSKEYEKEKINLETIANKMYKLHGLAQKNSQLVKSHWNMQILLKRYESLSQKQLQTMDIINEVENFQFLQKSCRNILKNFLEAIVKKVVEFLENTVESTMIYSSQLKKVKSFDDRGFKETITVNNMANFQSPRSISHNLLNEDSRNTIKNVPKITALYQYGNMGDRNIEIKIRGVYQTLKNNSTVESLRQRQKANNEYLFRQSKQKNILSENSLTREALKSSRSYQGQQSKFYDYSPSLNYLRPQNNSKDSSMKSIKSYYDQSKALKKHKSSSNLQQNPDASLSRKFTHPETSRNPISIQEFRVSQKSLIKETSGRKSPKCLHHCPHHDKLLGNHCSKHCEKISPHEKMMFNDFGLDLTKMDRNYYESRYNNSNQSMASATSFGVGSSRGKRQNQSRDIAYGYTNRQRNLAEMNHYLRNSHDKHLGYYDAGRSPMNKPSSRFQDSLQPLKYQKNQNQYFDQRTGRLNQNTAQKHLNLQKLKYQSPPARSTEYFYYK